MLNKTQIEKLLITSIFGRYLYVFKEIDSTNSFAHKIAKEGAPEGTVVIADYQKDGKGRSGHHWQSDDSVNILMSMILRPELDIECIKRITLATSNILIQSLNKFLESEKIENITFCVKWPNNIMVDEKKIASILTESSVIDKRIEYVVVGICINVNQEISRLNEDIQSEATSIYKETGREISREKLIKQILMDFEAKYFYLERTSYNTVIEDWKKHCSQIGKLLLIETPLCVEHGYFVDIDDQGVLIYKDKSGELKKLIKGTIKLDKAINGIND